MSISIDSPEIIEDINQIKEVNRQSSRVGKNPGFIKVSYDRKNVLNTGLSSLNPFFEVSFFFKFFN